MNMSISKKISSLINEDNKTILIGLLTLLIGLWIVIYLIPSFFVSLFNTILGNIILVILVILVGIQNYKYGLMLALSLIIFIRFVELIKKEGFELSQNSINDFLEIQHTTNSGIVFDMDQIKQQVTQEELDYFLQNGKWYWSDDVINLYKEAIDKNKYIRTSSEDSVNYAQTIYNQNAILKILSLQTKEAAFLLSGVKVNDCDSNKAEELPSGFGEFGYNSGLTEHRYPVIKCKMDDNGNSALEKTTYTGKGGRYGEQTSIKSEIDYNNLEKEIPGFKFITNPCNPCKAINNESDYSCPFILDIKGVDSGISNVWRYLWASEAIGYSDRIGV